MKKQIVLSLLLLPSLAQAESPSWSKTTFAIGACVAAPVMYGLYKLAGRYIQARTDREIIHAIKTFCVSPLGDTSENVLREKAKLFCMRKRIMQKLAITAGQLTGEHKKQARISLLKAELSFALMDKARLYMPKNPYEKEYENPSWFERFIEQRMVDNIILAYKPNAECSKKELAAKATMNEQRTRIIQKFFKESETLGAVATTFFNFIMPA